MTMDGLQLREPIIIDGLTITEVRIEITERRRAGVQADELRLLAGTVLDEPSSVMVATTPDGPAVWPMRLNPGARLFGVLVV